MIVAEFVGQLFFCCLVDFVFVVAFLFCCRCSFVFFVVMGGIACKVIRDEMKRKYVGQ